MTMLGPIDLSLLSGGFFREYTDIQPFSYRDGMTYTSELEALRAWTFRTLVPFLNDNFSDMQDSWEVNVHTLTDAINAGLAAQTADNAQKIADALTAIAEADIPITDPGILAVLNHPETSTRAWLDAHYAPKTASGYVEKTPAAANAITGWFHVDDFGAKGDGTTKDHAAIQAAIDAAAAAYTTTGILQRVYFGARTYLCGNTVANNPVAGIVLKSGVELTGTATIKTAPDAYWTGTLYALLRSPVTGTLTHAGVRGLTFDGNAAAITVPGGNQQASNIVLGLCSDVWLDGITSTNSAGEGIQVAAPVGAASRDVRIVNCIVTNCGRIGIQVSQFDGITIRGNTVSWTQDNGIDIYGEQGTAVSSGVNFDISDNTVHNCGNGIFPETVASGRIAGNTIRDSGTDGIHINRINGAPGNILVTGNRIYGGQNAVWGTGDTDGVTIRGNLFGGFNQAGVALGGSGNVSGYFILDNTMDGNADSTPKVLIKSGTNQAAQIIHTRTVTWSKNRSVDTVNYCTNNANLSYTPAFSPGD